MNNLQPTIITNMKTIPGFSNYCVDIEGNIYTKQHSTERKSKPRKDGTRGTQFNHIKAGMKKLTNNKVTGYLSCCMFNDEGVPKTLYIHRAVGLTYLQNPNNYSDIDHKDGNRHNNNVSNLEWVDHKENIRRANIRKYSKETI